MEERTRAYLRGRFRDYYRRSEVPQPPALDRREWGYIPWTAGEGTTMIRHQSLLDLGDLEGFLARERPRHVYFSAGRYRDPGAESMGAKDWQGSDLIFDLDADHLPDVDPDEASYASMLAACKEELQDLLSILRADFGFEELELAFSGGRGYHVHVRDEGVANLDREARREIVDYIRGMGVEFEDLVHTKQRGSATSRVLETDGGWGRRVHHRFLSYIDELVTMDETEATEQLLTFDMIGEKRAAAIQTVVDEHRADLADGQIELGGPAIRTLAKALTEETIETERAAIDEPVTTDTHRLIRLPGSLHGGTGLRVTPIDPDELDTFDPLVDTIPETFVGHEVTVRTDGGPPVDLGGETFRIPAGVTSLPEYVAVFLMTRGRAEKEKE